MPRRPATSAPEVFRSPPSRGGRPAYEPDDKDRKVVMLGKLAGLTQERIAAELGISVETMKKHLGPELRQGKAHFVMRIVGTMAQIALDKKHPRVVQAGAYLLNRFGLEEEPHEGETIDHEGDPHAPPQPPATVFTLKIGGKGGG